MFQCLLTFVIGVIIGYKCLPIIINKIKETKNKKGDKD